MTKILTCESLCPVLGQGWHVNALMYFMELMYLIDVEYL